MSDDQIFDQPVEAYLADRHVLKWCQPTSQSVHANLESLASTPASSQRQELVSAVSSALAAWDPNRGPEHEAEVRERLDKALDTISQQAIAKLSASERQALRLRQKQHMGYAYLFIATPDELMLNAQQQQALADLSRRATADAVTATGREMESIQIRNPQAYLAYKISKLHEQAHKRQVELGKEFYERTLSKQQQAQLELSSPVE